VGLDFLGVDFVTQLSLNPWIGDLMPLRGPRFGAIRRGGDVGGHG
jgi:hypothetical protein